MNIIIGFDPGSTSAAYGIVTAQGRFIHVDDAPRLDSPMNAAVLANHLDGYIAGASEARVIIEQVHAYTGQGVSSSFRFGVGYGIIQGIVGAYGLKAIMVRPQTWKKSLGLDSSADRSLKLARELYPDAAHLLKRIKDHNRAEALLLAHYGLKAL